MTDILRACWEKISAQQQNMSDLRKEEEVEEENGGPSWPKVDSEAWMWYRECEDVFAKTCFGDNNFAEIYVVGRLNLWILQV